ncbi:hypothetical protein Bca4012_074363 [Brassica carinata]
MPHLGSPKLQPRSGYASAFEQRLGETFTPTKATEEEAMTNKEKAWERREKRMHEISLLRSIPYSDHQRSQDSFGLTVVLTARNVDAGLEAVTSLSLQEGLKVDFHQLDITVLIAHFLVSAGDADESSCHISSVAAILDFGFATVLVTQGKNLKLTGTLGNRASEYFLYGKVTDKNDVYSFGSCMLMSSNVPSY